MTRRALRVCAAVVGAAAGVVAGPLACLVAGLLPFPCNGDVNCPPGQVCVDGACAATAALLDAGTPVPDGTFEHWGSNQPDDGVLANCLALAVDGPDRLFWLDRSCEEALPFVCEGESLAEPPADAGCLADVDRGARRWFCLTALPFTDAAAHCRENGGALARVDGADEGLLVVDGCEQHRIATGRAWLGGSDAAVEGEWRWPDGAAFPVDPFSRWSANEPNNFNGNEDCLELDEDDLWNDLACTASEGFACGSVPADADVDGCRTIEVNAARYAVCPGPAAYDDAAAVCAGAGATLAVVDSRAVHDALAAERRAFDAPAADGGVNIRELWLGGDDRETDGVWRWVDGALIDDFTE